MYFKFSAYKSMKNMQYFKTPNGFTAYFIIHNMQ